MARVLLLILMVFVGGAAGTGARAAVVGVAESLGWSVWIALLIVNTVGAFGLGWFASSPRSVERRALIGVGALGSFTTFSGVTVEFVEDVRTGDGLFALLIVAAMIGVGLVAVVAGGRVRA